MARILIISYRFFDHDPRLRGHTDAFLRRGDSVDVICLGRDRPPAETGANIIGLPQIKYRGTSPALYLLHYLRFFSATALIALKRSMRQAYDIVLVISMPDAAIFSALAIKLFGSKIILDITDPMPELFSARFGGRLGRFGNPLLRFQERMSALVADQVFAVHEVHWRRLERAGVDPAKMTIVMNSPDPAIFRFRTMNSRSGESFTLMFHGSVLARQGIDTAIRAIALLSKTVSNLRLRVVGFGDYISAARALAEALGMIGQVSFETPVPLERVPDLLADVDVGLVPLHANRATHMMLPVKLLEYATLGIPIIAARLEAIEYHFAESAIRYFEPDNAEDLAKAIQELYFHPEIRARMVENGSRAVEAFAWEIQRSQFYNAVDTLLGVTTDIASTCKPATGVKKAFISGSITS